MLNQKKTRWFVRAENNKFSLYFDNRNEARRYKKSLEASVRNLNSDIVKIKSYGLYLTEERTS